LRHKCNVTGETHTFYPPSWLENAEQRKKEREAAKPVKQQPNEPGLLQKTVNYTKAKASHVWHGSPEVTDEQMAERFAICQSNQCGLYIAKGEGLGTCGHKSCGCPLKRVSEKGEDSKLRWADQQCPATNPETGRSYWGKIQVITPET
jgi:hypothetical protein